MPAQPKKFNAVRATRVSLLMALSLSVGIGTTLYAPLLHSKASKSSVRQAVGAAGTGSALPTTARQLDQVPDARPTVVSSPPVLRVAPTQALSPVPAVQQESASVPAPDQPVLREDTEDGAGDMETGAVSTVRLVKVAQRTSGIKRVTTNRAAAPRLSGRITPAGVAPSRSQARPTATVPRLVVPQIVRRPAAPVIATTSAS